MPDNENRAPTNHHMPWNKGKLIGARPPLRPKHVWSIRTRLLVEGEYVTSPCLTWLSIASFVAAMSSRSRSRMLPQTAIQRTVQRYGRTGRPVKFELTDQTRQAVDDYLKAAGKKPGDFLFTGRRGFGQCITTRQYSRLLSEWIASIGLDPKLFGTHSLRRTKATLIYRRTGNLRAVQLLLGHTKIESTVRYLGIEVDDVRSRQKRTIGDPLHSAPIGAWMRDARSLAMRV
jgi:integrase